MMLARSLVTRAHYSARCESPCHTQRPPHPVAGEALRALPVGGREAGRPPGLSLPGPRENFDFLFFPSLERPVEGGKGVARFCVGGRAWESRQPGHRGHRPLWTLVTLLTTNTALSPAPCPGRVLSGCRRHPSPPLQPITPLSCLGRSRPFTRPTLPGAAPRPLLPRPWPPPNPTAR